MSHPNFASKTAATGGTADLRKRIVSRLSNDEWMNRHFGISCHAGDVADAVMEVLAEHRDELHEKVAALVHVEGGEVPCTDLAAVLAGTFAPRPQVRNSDTEMP